VRIRVLLAIDGSSYSIMGARMLKTLQPSAEADVRLLTVVPEHTFLGGFTLQSVRGIRVGKEKSREAEERHAHGLLQEPAEVLRAAGFTVESRVARGNPAAKILEQAREMQADLVVIGAKGTATSPRFPLGSTAQKVMKYSSTNVLLVREGPTTIRRVLVATDGSAYSDEVTRFLLDLPLPGRTEVQVVAALHSFVRPNGSGLMPGPRVDERTLSQLRAAEERAALALVEKWRNTIRDRGLDVSCMVLRGEPAEEILMAADTFCPELIALGAKGLSASDSFLLGSVAQRVARFSQFSVLLGRLRRAA